MTPEQFNLNDLKKVKVELTRFMMAYQFALDEVNTKINILKDEFTYIHDYNPIEHVKSRLKSPESILNKIIKKECPLSLDSIKENIRDIAGIRINVSFISDIYEISKMLSSQKDIRVIEYKDYIKNPKPNGYQSLHMILEIPIFMSDREELVNVEVQIRTIAMDFWASLEHKIYYKYNKGIPKELRQELKEAADVAAQLDKKMERLNREINAYKESANEQEKADPIITIDKKQFQLPFALIESFISEK